MSALLADAFPDDYCTQLFARTTKPVAVSESSYPAEAWSNQAGLVWHGSREKQQAVLDRMLAAAATAGARYFVWFAARDFDELWENTLGKSELALVWRDTGLFAADGGERMALKTWRAWLKRAIE
jgi:hypothetical protein